LPSDKTWPPGAQIQEKTGQNGVQTWKIQEITRKLSFFPEFLWMFSA